MVLSFTILILLSGFYSAQCINFVNTIKYQDLVSYEKQCSHLKLKIYQKNYFLTKQFSIYKYFSKLEKLKCFETIKKECLLKTFNFNEYTNDVYSRFCDRNKLKKLCIPFITNELKLDKTYLYKLSWKNVTELSLNASKKRLKTKHSNICFLLAVLENLEKLPEIEIFEKKGFDTFFCFFWQIELKENNVLIDTSFIENR